jgi:hypothetical protein
LRWSESIHIDRSPQSVFEAMLDQHSVIEWSAWPEATGYPCAVSGDGRSVGSEIVLPTRLESTWVNRRDGATVC